MLSNLFLAAAAQTIKFGGLRISLWWWPFVFAFFKNTLILLDILIVFAILLTISRYRTLSPKIYDAVAQAVSAGRLSPGKLQRKWEEVRELGASERLEERERGLEKAEKLLDDILKMSGVPGENLAKRLESIPENQLNFQDDLMWVYRFRESLIADPSFTPDEEEIKRAFYVYERTLKDLDVV